MTREEHLEWAKNRALSILDNSEAGARCRLAFVQFGADLAKFPANAGRYSSGVMMVGLLAATQDREPELRRWIEGFD